MGEVYRARDTKLGREVALKFLPATFASDPQRIARFRREAQVLASLNHPHIGAIYGLDEANDNSFLVLELVDGESLDKRIARGPIPIDEALAIARQIAEALEAAHDNGIVHRDLKPANIALTSRMSVKVLDFGLAKAIEQGSGIGDRASENPALSPTLTSPALMTSAGVILGTAAYMSPEQARGYPADRRSDIWAFGCVLYEMLSGSRSFGGDSLSDTIAAVLRGEPDWGRLPAGTPARIRVLLRRCLQKDARQRLHHAADVRIELEDSDAEATSPVEPRRRARIHTVAWIVLSIVCGAALASLLWWAGIRRPAVAAPIHLSLTLMNQPAPFVHMNASRELAISPDGQKIVYVAHRNGKRQLFLRALGDSEGKPIDGTVGAVAAFFSPDSQWIAFGTESALQKTAVSGGSPVTIASLSSTGFYGGDWGTDDRIVFVPDYNAGLWTVAADGGTPQPLLNTDVDKDRVCYSDPQILPGGRGVLFTLASGRAVTADDEDVAVIEPGSRDPRILIRGASHPRYLPTGHIVYVHAGALLAVTFNITTLAITGTPVPVIEGVGKTWSGDTAYSISDNGTLVYQADAGVPGGGLFVLADRKGNIRPVFTKRGNYSEFSISPDGRTLASRVFAVNDDIWTYDTTSGAPLRLTFEPLDEIYPQWTADGAHIAYGTRTGTIFSKSSDGSGSRQELTRGSFPRYPTSFSRDGRQMAFVEVHPSRRRDLWVMPLDGDRRPEPLIATDADEWGARFSPDGRWLAYVSDETGRDEVFIRPSGARGGRRQLSSDGGTRPAWGPNGRELFFAHGNQLSAVTLDGDGNAVGRDHVLYSAPKFEDLQLDEEAALYDVMPDGEHFVFLLEQTPSPTRYNVILNWFGELNARVPAR